MKEYDVNKVKNIAFAGHNGSGKTSLTEAILYKAGASDRLGKTADGTTVCDYDPEEIKRKISIGTSLASFEYNDYKVNILDTPGLFDFAAEMIEGIRAADTVMITVSAKSGVKVGTRKAYDEAVKQGKSKMFVVTKIDDKDANFFNVLTELKTVFGPTVCPVVVPVISSGKIVSYVNLIEMKAYKYDENGNAVETDMPTAEISEKFEYRIEGLLAAVSEAVAETSDELMEKFFEEMELPKEDILYGLSKGVKEGSVTPVVCVSALNNTGVKTLADNIVHYLPSAAEAKLPEATNGEGTPIELTRDGKMVCHVAKTINDQFGKYSIVKVMRGTLDISVAPYNVNVEKAEKATAPVLMRGKKTVAVDKLNAGDIGALPKLQYTSTNDTLCDQSDIVKIKPIVFPAACISMAINAKKQGEDDKVISGLNRIREEDPTITIEKNIETGDVLLCGLGEKHLDVVCGKLKNKFNVEATLTEQRIPYRETIRAMAEAEGKHKKQTGGSGQFGVVNIRFEPADEGVDFEFVDAIVGGVVPREYIPAVEKGLREAMVHGVLAGYPMIGVKATLYFGKYHPVDSKEVAFKSAARLAYKAACVKASPALIEPIYAYNIWVPNDNVGDIIGDLNRRRGRMLGMNPVDGGTEISAEAPLAEMTKYATDLLAMTQARGHFESHFVCYEDVPGDKAKKIIEAAKIEDEDEE